MIFHSNKHNLMINWKNLRRRNKNLMIVKYKYKHNQNKINNYNQKMI